MLREIRWIAFDAVGTLIFADPPVHLAYYRIGRRHGSQLRPEEVRLRFRDAFARRTRKESDAVGNAVSSETAVAITECSEAAEREFWRGVVAEALPDVRDRDACFEELFSHFARAEAWQPYADVEETLDEARRRGIRLAIASNFDARLHAVCDGIAELRTIERRVISSTVGARKPEPRFYQELVHACGCEPHELLMVGDEIENDVEGARRGGLQAVHLDRSTSTSHGRISTLADLWQVLAEAGANPV